MKNSNTYIPWVASYSIESKCRCKSLICSWSLSNLWLNSKFFSLRTKFSWSNWFKLLFNCSFSTRSSIFSRSTSSNFFCCLEHRSVRELKATFVVFKVGKELEMDPGDHIIKWFENGFQKFRRKKGFNFSCFDFSDWNWMQKTQ